MQGAMGLNKTWLDSPAGEFEVGSRGSCRDHCRSVECSEDRDSISSCVNNYSADDRNEKEPVVIQVCSVSEAGRYRDAGISGCWRVESIRCIRFLHCSGMARR